VNLAAVQIVYFVSRITIWSCYYFSAGSIDL